MSRSHSKAAWSALGRGASPLPASPLSMRSFMAAKAHCTTPPTAVFAFSTSSSGRPTTATTVTLCAKMAGVIPWLKSSSLYRLSALRSSRAIFPATPRDGFAIEIWEFVELIQVSARPEVDAAEGLKSLALGEAIYESAFTGEVIRLDEILSGQRDHYQAPINAHWKL